MPTKKIINPVIIYFILWCVYNLQGVFYATGSFISRGLLLVILTWSIISTIRVNLSQSPKPNFFKALNVFLIVTTFYGVLLILSGKELYITEVTRVKTSNIEYLKNIYISLLPIFVFYEAALNRRLTISVLKWLTLCLFAVAIVKYFHDKQEQILLAVQKGITRDGFTLNVGYSFVAMMPLLLFWRRKPFFQFILLIVCMVFIILCMKRGAILIGVLCFLYFLYSIYSGAKGKTRLLVSLLSIIAIIAMVIVSANLINTNDYFLQRIEQTLDGDSSNRDSLYSLYFNHFMSETNFFRFFFGNGANATLTIGFNYAHNDWLEIAINNGFFGLILYVWYYVALIKDCLKAKTSHSQYASVLLMALLIMFLSSLFSMSYGSLELALSMALGVGLAFAYNHKLAIIY